MAAGLMVPLRLVVPSLSGRTPGAAVHLADASVVAVPTINPMSTAPTMARDGEPVCRRRCCFHGASAITREAKQYAGPGGGVGGRQ